MSYRDGKDRFYRNLNLDNKLRKCIKHFRSIADKMKNDGKQQDAPKEEKL